MTNIQSKATSGYLNLPLRTIAQARRDIFVKENPHTCTDDGSWFSWSTREVCQRSGGGDLTNAFTFRPRVEGGLTPHDNFEVCQDCAGVLA